MERLSIKVVPNFEVCIRGLVCFFDDKIHYWLRILRPDRKMALALPDDHREISAEFLVFLLGHPRLAVEPRIEAAANVQERFAGLGERPSVVNGPHCCV